MKIYLDICSLKRPFDDQSQARVALETMAVVSILEAVESGRLQAVRSLAHEIENSRNPDTRRAETVRRWLGSLNRLERTPSSVRKRTRRLREAGLPAIDSFHLAWAEYLRVQYLITTDDRFLSRAVRAEIGSAVNVVDPVSFLREIER